MPPWIAIINTLLKSEIRSNRFTWVQLASIGLDNTPSVRTVVFRGWTDSYEMVIFTDKRSQKYQELKANDNVEICWLFSESKSQFRLRGNARIEIEKDNRLYWDQLNDQSKKMWSWPTPGKHFNKIQNKPLTFSKETKISENFIVLRIDITYVDQLTLHDPAHMRRRWLREKEWVEERINP